MFRYIMITVVLIASGVVAVFFFLPDMFMTKGTPEGYLVQVGDSYLMPVDFNKSLETALVAYPYDIVNQPKAFENIKLNLLEQLIHRMIIMERAEELQLRVTEADLKAEIDQIKRNYPEEAFQKMLLESAVSYQYWKNELRARMLMEKVIREDLSDQVAVTSQDVIEYFRKNKSDENENDTTETTTPIPDEGLINRLQHQKREDAYADWFRELKARYPVMINRVELDRIMKTD